MRCLVVDDSALYRKIIREVLSAESDVEVVGSANNGLIALDQIKALRPDLLTLDLEMPRLDGLGLLREMQTRGVDVPTIVVGSLTANSAKATTEALSLGAFDFILKPSTSSFEQSVTQLRQDLLPKVNALRLRRAAHARPQPSAARAPVARPPAAPRTPPAKPRLPGLRPEVVVIGISTGGPQALTQILPRIPHDFRVPILIVQHMPEIFTKSLADDLDRRCKLKVSEATHGQTVCRGEILIAPGGRHMRLAKNGADTIVEITNDPPEKNCRPAADYLFRSAASVYGSRVLGAVLTGMGDDGTLGAQHIKQAGGSIIAQDEASCTVYGMPKSVIDAGHADAVVSLKAVPDRLTAAVLGKVLV